MHRQPVPLPRQFTLSPKEIALFPHKQVAHRQPALTPRVIALSPLRQAVPRMGALVPRQPASLLRQVVPGQRALMSMPTPLPKQAALTPRELVVLPQFPQASRQAISANNPLGSPRGNSLEDPNPKWVMNLSSKPFTQTQRSVLAKGPHFVVSPRHHPNLEYIMGIESVCTKLGQ